MGLSCEKPGRTGLSCENPAAPPCRAAPSLDSKHRERAPTSHGRVVSRHQPTSANSSLSGKLDSTIPRRSALSWVYWLFLAVFAVALYRLFRDRHRAHEAGRPAGALAGLSTYGFPLLVAALFLAYVLAGHVARGFLVALLIISGLAPFIVSFTAGFAGEQHAQRVRAFFLIVIAALTALVVLAFLVKLLLLLVAVLGVVALLIVVAALLGFFRHR